MADVAIELGARRVFVKGTSSSGDMGPGDLAVLSVNTESVVPGTAATSLGKAEDAVAASGDTGVAALVVRRDTASAGGADGDYVNPSTDANGSLRTVAGGYQKSVEGTVNGANTIAAAGDYTAGDILSNSTSAGVAWRFVDAARVSGGSGIIFNAEIHGSVAALVPRFRLWLFNSNPSGSTLNDNAAKSIVIADGTKLVGYIDFPAMINVGTASFTQNVDSRVGFTASGSADLWGILETLDAFTNETASMTINIRLQIAQD